MILHADKVVEVVEKYAESEPVIFAGDFNTTPDKPYYSNLTKSLSSAYKTFNKTEPKQTCRAHPSYSKDMFSDCIDYVFYNGLEVVSVEQLEESEELMPNKNEPSDHLLLSAKFKFIY